MNREQRRKMQNDHSISDSVRKLAKIKYIQSLFAGRFKEGDKVNLAYERMTSNPTWEKKDATFKCWCEQHKNDELTVEYDADKKENPSLVCLSEDNSNPKWLFSTIDLSPVNGDEKEFLDKLKWGTKDKL